ncbi:hypothetical protein [Clostridium sp. Marseille-QA1073]
MRLTPKVSKENIKDLGNIKILDSSIVIASLKLFPWTNYKSEIDGIKFHTLFYLI